VLLAALRRTDAITFRRVALVGVHDRWREERGRLRRQVLPAADAQSGRGGPANASGGVAALSHAACAGRDEALVIAQAAGRAEHAEPAGDARAMSISHETIFLLLFV